MMCRNYLISLTLFAVTWLPNGNAQHPHSNINLVGHLPDGPCYGVTLIDDIVLIGNGTSLEVKKFLNASNPHDPVLKSVCDTDYFPTNLTIHDQKAYVAEHNGFCLIDVSLYQNYPNPFNPSTTISYSIKGEGRVKLDILNCSGQLIISLIDKEQVRGFYVVHWDGTDTHGFSVPSGLFFYQKNLHGTRQTKKIEPSRRWLCLSCVRQKFELRICHRQ